MSRPSRKKSSAFGELRKFAALLSWKRLRRCEHRDSATGNLVVWYEAGDVTFGRNHFGIQINEFPCGQETRYEACVFAIRYRLCSGWHLFTRKESIDFLAKEAGRLSTWLDRSCFATLETRRHYRKLHPMCAGYGWHRISTLGYPVADARRERVMRER